MTNMNSSPDNIRPTAVSSTNPGIWERMFHVDREEPPSGSTVVAVERVSGQVIPKPTYSKLISQIGNMSDLAPLEATLQPDAIEDFPGQQRALAELIVRYGALLNFIRSADFKVTIKLAHDVVVKHPPVD